MNQNDQDMKQYNEILDIILRSALVSNINSHYGAVPSEEEIRENHTFSDDFQERMRRMFLENREQESQDIGEEAGEKLPDFLSLDHSFWEEWKTAARNPETDTVNSDDSDNNALPCLIGENTEDSQGEKTWNSVQKTGGSGQMETGGHTEENDIACQADTEEKATSPEQASMELLEKCIPNSKHIHTARSEETAGENCVLPPEEIKPKKAGNRARKIRKGFKIAAAAAVAVGILGVGLFRFEPIRASFRQTMVNYEGQGVLITNDREDDYHIVFRDPTYVPRGYEIIENYEDKSIKWLKYSNKNKEIKITYTLFDGDIDCTVDNERYLSSVKDVLIKRKYEATLFVVQNNADENEKILLWQNGMVQYQICGYESEEILVKIAESIMQ